ncbi:hypothetical protein NDU88_001489 [Pleurodeles waltl]|uniref:Uncharacterized protein n=1 Tax=Pleurodeles waltl TaxID=8319 RepID=A0AAV7TIG1_PLEWA|nr:hypothetical protein NDU88_001489 [Pleurodeles waltl]
MSSNVDSPGNTSGAGFVEPEETSGRRRRRGVEDEGRADRDVDRRRFLLSEAQQTGPLGGSKTLKPATL